MRQRTTRDVWQIHVHYGQGWEYEIAEFSRSEAIARLREYRANCSYPVKIVKRRERIVQT